MKRKFLSFVSALGIGAYILALGDTPLSHENHIIVQTGEIRYSSGKPLYSPFFSICSAIIFDYQNQAFMIHAVPAQRKYPMLLERALKMGDHTTLSTGNAIDILLRYAEEKGIDPRKGEVILDIGETRDFYGLSRRLKEEGIPMREIRFSNAKSRNITYNPKTDEVKIEFNPPEWSNPQP